MYKHAKRHGNQTPIGRMINTDDQPTFGSQLQLNMKKPSVRDSNILSGYSEIESGLCDSSATGTDLRNRNSKPLNEDLSFDQSQYSPKIPLPHTLRLKMS